MEHKLITGGEQYLPFARSRIKALRATGLKYASQQFEIDGSSIKVRIQGDQEFITLTGGLPKILSGAIKGGTLFDLPIPPGSPTGTAPRKTLRAYKPTPNAWDFPLKKDPLKPVTAFNDETFLANAGDQYSWASPSIYSGRMAKAVAIIMGMGKRAVYDYHWVKCHGITEASDGRMWLIEISAAEGVMAMPFPKSKGNATSSVDAVRMATLEFGGVPMNTTFPTGEDLIRAIASGRVRRLKTSSEMTAFFGKAPYSPTMGWSFNDSGSEAHNTCFSTDGTAFTGHHYKLDIAINTSSGVTTASATLSLVSEGPLTAKQLLPGGVYFAPPCTFSDVDTGAQYAVPVQNIDYGITESTALTPLIACHINGVLDVVSVATVPDPTYDYVTTGPDESLGAFTVTEIGSPAGRHMRYGGFNAKLDGFSISRYTVSTPASGIVTVGSLRYIAYESVKETRSRLEAGRVTWGRAARDTYTVFRPKATVVNEVGHVSLSFDDAAFAAGALAYDCITIQPTTVTGGMDVCPMGSGSVSFPHIEPITAVKHPIAFAIRNGVVPDVDDDVALWTLASPRVVFNVFGTAGQMACTEAGYARFIGAFLDISDPAPEINYTFIGYL